MLTKRQIYFILVVLCFLLYANSLNNAFVSDDIPSILKDPAIKNPWHYRFSPWALLDSFAYLIKKDNPFLHHLFSIIFHSINTVLVFFFLSLFFKTEASFLGAVLFAVHPIHTEAVTWISGRGYIFISIFVLITYFLYRRAGYSETRPYKAKIWYYLASLILFVYFIVSQISFFSFTPLFFILSDITLKKWRKNWKLWIPFVVIVALRLFLVRGLIASRIEAVAKEVGRGPAQSDPSFIFSLIYNMSYSLFCHVGLLIWPKNLTLYHEPPVITRFALNIELVILGLLVLALPFIFKKAKPIFLAMAILVIFLIPTYSPKLISWLVAERYVYFPSIALSMVFGFAYEKYVRNSQPRRKTALILCSIIFAGYAVRTVIRNEDWKTPQRFWLATAEVSPLSPRAHNNMGDAYAQEQNFSGAINEFKKSVELKPDYADAYHNLANIYQHIGNLPEAVTNYQKAVSLNPQLFESRYNLGVIYVNAGQFDKAIEMLSKAVQLRPEDSGVSSALVFAIRKQSEKK